MKTSFSILAPCDPTDFFYSLLWIRLLLQTADVSKAFTRRCKCPDCRCNQSLTRAPDCADLILSNSLQLWRYIMVLLLLTENRMELIEMLPVWEIHNATGLNFVIVLSVSSSERQPIMYLQRGHLESACITFISEETNDIFQPCNLAVQLNRIQVWNLTHLSCQAPIEIVFSWS